MIMKWLNLKWIAKHVPHSFRSPTSSPIYHTHSTTVNFLHSTVHIDSLITVCCHSTLYSVRDTTSTRIASAHLSFILLWLQLFIHDAANNTGTIWQVSSTQVCILSSTCVCSVLWQVCRLILSGGICVNWSQANVTRDVISGWRRYRDKTAGNIKEQQ